MIALLCRGHVLLEGRARRGEDPAGPGAVRRAGAGPRARAVHARPDARRRHRLAGLRRPHGEFSFREGPVFTNLLLADEINRTPPKTQASLLEAMEERQVTRRRPAAPAARPVRRRRHPEPGRVRGHLPAARGPARPLPAQADRAAARPRDEVEVLAAARRRLRPARPRRGRGAPGRRRRGPRRRARPPSARGAGRPRGARATSSTCAGPPAPRRRCRWARRRAAPPRCWPRRGRGPGCPAATT